MWRDFIREFAETQPDKLAIVDRITSRPYSYRALRESIESWAAWLHHRGIGRGDRVVYLATNSMEHILLFFACARVGAILVSLNHRLPMLELAGILELVEPQLFLGNIPPPLGQTFVYQSLASVDLTLPLEAAPAHDVRLEDPMMMLFTSGSTGTPKGVLFHAGMIMANIRNTIDTGVLFTDDISVVNTPFFHTGAYHVFLLPLLSIGGTLILFDRFDPGDLLAAVERERLTIFWAVPTMFQMLLDHPAFATTDFSRIRVLLSGGAPLSLSLIQGYHQRGVAFKQGFGLTEVGPNCFLLDTADCWRFPESIGKPMPLSRTRVVDEAGNEVGPDQTGELWLAGPHVCLGYWRREALFREMMHDGFFATGDLVKRNREGYFFVVGRKKDMYISGGENVYPGEVERQLLTHPAITQAVVVAVADGKWGEVGYAYVVATEEVTLPALQAFLRERLVRFKHPHYMERLPAMPLLANGKIDRVTLKGMAAAAVGV
ncbi:MAG: AMP-binding protein [Magnetococcales bacterium]|nr:AMP-binding protein [Magnetococcales bacterium]MBF0156581.1 AMP-binding protein [Magnetococcales bacterium]